MRATLNCFLVIVCALFCISNLFSEDEANKKEKSKEEKRSEPEIKDIEISGILSKVFSLKDLPAGSKEKSSWYVVEIKDGYLIKLPEKIDNKEIDFKQYEGKEVIVKGKGTEEIVKIEGMKKVAVNKEETLDERKETSTNVKLPNFISLASIDIKSSVSKKDEKSPTKKKEENKDPGNVPVN